MMQTRTPKVFGNGCLVLIDSGKGREAQEKVFGGYLGGYLYVHGTDIDV